MTAFEALNIAEDFALPLDAVTETFAILAKRGSGKTYTAAVMVEEMLEHGQQVVVIDPIGVWYGLRSSADGKKPGYPVVIFGGDHADVPLQETAGQLIADVLVEHKTSAVLDLSHLSKGASRRFMTEFAERLYHRNREPLHLAIDEADAFAPQRAAHGGERLLGAMEDLVRRGRARGLGITLITQRPAVLNKDVLTQAEVLIVGRMTGPRDIQAMYEWVRIHADETEAKAIEKSLPGLKVGTMWLWSPGWLGIDAQLINIRKRRTFDSSSTPKAGQIVRQPSKMTDIDIAALGEQIQATVEQAHADDPRTLRARIAELETELDVERRKPKETERVEVPVFTPKELDVIMVFGSDLVSIAGEMQGLGNKILDAVSGTNLEQARALVQHPTKAQIANPPSFDKPVMVRPAAVKEIQGYQYPSEGDVQLKAGARRILETLARLHPRRLTKAEIGTLAHFKITGGTFSTYWSNIKRNGFIWEANDDSFGITQAGLDYIGHVPRQPMTTEELQEMWRGTLKAGARQMLDELIGAYPKGYTRDDLAEVVGMTASGGTFSTYLSTLRRNNLIEISDGLVTASPTLFLG